MARLDEIARIIGEEFPELTAEDRKELAERIKVVR